MKNIAYTRTPVLTKKSSIRISKKLIPKSLIYEEIDGKPIYYKDFEQVVNQQKTEEEIMGTSALQILIINYICDYLKKTISLEKYIVLNSELGLHISKGNNLAADIAIYEKSALKKIIIEDKYLEIPPEIVFEVDTKADLNYLVPKINYFDTKTQKLFDFGVEKVFWVMTQSRKIIVASPNQPWQIMNWDMEIEVMENCKFILTNLLSEDGLIK